ncbi:MAG: hypothetical protein V1778_00725 [bacterium]
MATVVFSINLKEDAENWVRVGKTKKPKYGRSHADFVSEIPKEKLHVIQKLSRARAVSYMFRDLERRKKNFLTDFQAMKTLLDEYFAKRGTALLIEVARLTGKPLYAKRFFATFTLLGTCPYNPERRWFMIPAKKNMPIQLKTVCHEILHMQFIHYYHRYCRESGLSEKQFQDLKEALTVLLNLPKFRKYHIALDVGYSDHTLLRKKLLLLWRQHKDFHRFLDAAILEAKNFPA